MVRKAKQVTIESLGEFGLINQIKKWVPCASGSVVKGIGDDTAILPISKGRYQLLTIDTLVEDIDFKQSKATPERIGWKALAINLSDIAAMGGSPKIAVVSLTLPKQTSIKFVRGFYQGVQKLARRFKVSIAGGDLSSGPKIVSSIAMLGESKRRWAVLRNGAKVGDLLCVTGQLGGSILGKHLTFMPRVHEGQFIARHGASAMIDISDGLGQDLNHLMNDSRVGFIIDESKVPISQAAFRLSRRNPKQALIRAFCDGEDFELLFTIAPSKFKVLKRSWSRRFSIPLTVIGQVVRVSKTLFKPRRYLGYQHF